MQGRDISSMVGFIPVFAAMYVFTKYCFTTPFSITAVSFVATPSVSNSLDPDLPGVLARSRSVKPSLNILSPAEPSRNDIFCCIDAALRAVRIGETSRDVTLVSTTIL